MHRRTLALSSGSCPDGARRSHERREAMRYLKTMNRLPWMVSLSLQLPLRSSAHAVTSVTVEGQSSPSSRPMSPH